MPQRLFRLSDLLANKYNIVVLGEDKPINYEDIKNKNTKSLKEEASVLAKLVFEAQDFRKLAHNTDPNISFSEEAQKTIDNCLAIESAINYLNNKKDELSLEEMIKPILDMQSSLLEVLKGGEGTEDRWGLQRSKYLPILKVLSETKTTMGAFHDPTKMDAMSKRDLDREFGRITNFLDSVGNHLRKMLGILKRSGVHGMIDKIQKEKAVAKAPTIGDTSRVPATAADHELRQVMRTFPDELGITSLGLNPDNIMTWKKYLPDAEGGTPLSSTLGRVIYHALGTSARYTPGMDVPAGSKIISWMVQGVPRQKVISPAILRNLAVLRNRLTQQYKILKAKEQKSTEQQFGSPTYQAFEGGGVMPPKIKPQPSTTNPNIAEDIRETILGFSDTERALWDTIPRETKQSILRGDTDLTQALEEAQRAQQSNVPTEPEFK